MSENVSLVSTGNYMIAEDLVSGTVPMGELHIKSVKLEPMKETRKLVVRFNETDKGLVLNETNKVCLRNSFGRDPNEWVGRSVWLYLVDVKTLSGKDVKGIRIKIQV